MSDLKPEKKRKLRRPRGYRGPTPEDVTREALQLLHCKMNFIGWNALPVEVRDKFERDGLGHA